MLVFVFDKTLNTKVHKVNIPSTIKVNRRTKIKNKLSKSNKEFLKALGFKL